MMLETNYWKSLLKCRAFCGEVGVNQSMEVNDFIHEIKTNRQFRLTVTIAVLNRFMQSNACLKQASNGGLNAGVQLFF